MPEFNGRVIARVPESMLFPTTGPFADRTETGCTFSKAFSRAMANGPSVNAPAFVPETNA